MDEVKTGRGKKKCPKCGTIQGARSLECISCHAKFKQSESQPKAEPPKAKPEPSCGFAGFSGEITTPAGKCPVKPQRYKDGGFPDGPATDGEILAWAEEVRAAGWEKGLKFSVEAICYFTREFWPISTPEWKRVCTVILQGNLS